MRHVCVQAVANRDRCEVGPLGPSPTNVADTSRWQTACEGDGGHLYVTQVRESIGPLETEVVLRLETLLVLGGSAGSLPRALPTRPGAVCLWALRGEPEGIRRSRFLEALGEEASDALGKLEASGLVTRAAPAEAGDDDAAAVVHRLTAEGREALDDRVRKLEEEVAAAFEGVSMEDLALARDGCWRIVLNCLTAAAR